MPAENLLYESMTRIVWGPWTIRVWRQWDGGVAGNNEDIWQAILSIDPARETYNDYLIRLLALDRVNAAEIVDAAGNGAVVYKDWP